MKTFTGIVLIAITINLFACKKENSGNGLTGKWRLSETLADPGDGSGKWMAIPKKTNYDYVKFDSHGQLESTVFSGYVSYVVKDSVTLTFSTKDNVIQNYRYAIKGDTISMSPAGPIFCYEACGMRFVKVR